MEQRLVNAAKSGDHLATKKLIVQYRPMIKVIAKRFYLVGGDRDDLIQEGMIAFSKAIRDYRPVHGANFRTFAELCVTRHLCTTIKAYNRQKYGPLNHSVSFSQFADEGEGRDFLETYFDPQQGNPENKVITDWEIQAILNGLLTNLSALEKRVLYLYYEGFSYSEMAEIIGCGAKSIDNALWRIKQKLKRQVHQLQ